MHVTIANELNWTPEIIELEHPYFYMKGQVGSSPWNKWEAEGNEGLSAVVRTFHNFLYWVQ